MSRSGHPQHNISMDNPSVVWSGHPEHDKHKWMVEQVVLWTPTAQPQYGQPQRSVVWTPRTHRGEKMGC
ncbi:hypothetical protein CVT25_004685 [Psilocybe cyanescens]|uniref:Uncharacterized protein n=1 Tax=Psilocybe cyanescens TaxID=93625 RepID=A0A409XRG1_PSICY|nr:hypothetical protein CVT25_004685 [Psilocybe cyanescens]